MSERDVWKEIEEEDRRDGFAWRYDEFGDWTTEAIFAKLAELGIKSDPEQFRRDALAAGDVRPLVKAWMKLSNAEESWDDFPGLTVKELWRRLLPDARCLLHVAATCSPS